MNPKLTPERLQRKAIVYIRQSLPQSIFSQPGKHKAWNVASLIEHAPWVSSKSWSFMMIWTHRFGFG